MPDALPVRPPCRRKVQVIIDGLAYGLECLRKEHPDGEDCKALVTAPGRLTS